MPEKKLTDADVMTGFNPAYGVSAEELEAAADAPATESAAPEGEGAEASATEDVASTASTDVDVRLDGRTFKAPKDIADAFTREINRRDGTRGAELQTLRERLAAVEARTVKPTEPENSAPPEPPVPNPELQIEDPARYQNEVLTRIRWEQEQKVQGLTRQYEEAEAARERETARRSAWAAHCDAFYGKPENAVLRQNQDIVDLVLKQNAEQLAPLGVEEGFVELGRLAKERLAKVTGQAPEIKARTNPKPPVLEGSGARKGAVRPAGGDEGPKSLSQALKDRRRSANEAFSKSQSRQTAAR